MVMMDSWKTRCTYLLLLLVLIGGSCANQRQKKTSSTSIPHGADWRFHAGEGKDSNWFAMAYDDSHWIDVVSNKTLVEQNVSLSEGFGWYRKNISFSKAEKKAIQQAEGAVLDLGRLAACEEVYVNGHLIGKTGEFPHDYAGYFDHHRRLYVSSDRFLLDKENLIAIKFHDGWSRAGGFLDGAILAVQPATTVDKLVLDVTVKDEDYIFLGKEGLAIQPRIENKSHNSMVKGTLSVKLLTDDHRFIQEEEVQVTIAPRSTYTTQLFGLPDPEPGFYRYDVTFELHGEQGQSLNKKFNVGYEPEQIISANDQKADFDVFWKKNLKELEKVAPRYTLTHLPEQSQFDYEMYLVTMHSLDNEEIKGYYAQPKREGEHPVIVEYMGYGSGPYFPNQIWDGFAYFVLSIRGQALNQPTNRFGTWFTYGIDNKDNYYYRGAFADVVRALDFVSSRQEIDQKRIAVRGSSQGGALSVVAAALDQRVKAAAIGIPFLSDYPDYFKICSWPRSDVETYLAQHPSVTWEQVYHTLSYFDVKNLASKITIPVVMGIGVQDEVCPPHINFAMYNQINAPKRWIAFGEYGHSTGSAFHEAGMHLFKQQLNVETP